MSAKSGSKNAAMDIFIRNDDHEISDGDEDNDNFDGYSKLFNHHNKKQSASHKRLVRSA